MYKIMIKIRLKESFLVIFSNLFYILITFYNLKYKK